MWKAVQSFFFHSGTQVIHKEKLISTVVVIVLITSFLIYRRTEKNRLTIEREFNKRYTIGITLKQYENFRSPNPTVKFKYYVFDKQELTEFAEIPNYLRGKVETENGRYYVQFSEKNPKNSKMLLDHPVPDSIVEAPNNGWRYMPGYEKESKK